MRHAGRHIAWALVLGTATAAAQPAPPSLDATIAEALALRVAGRDAEALVILTRAWEATRSPRALAQMARAEQALGRWLDAEQHMTEALAADDPWIVARRASLDEERARVRSHLGRIELLGLPDGARVRIDGRGPYAVPFAEPAWSAVGAVLVEVEAPGCYAVARRVVVDAGATTRETITLVHVPTEPPRAPDPAVVAPVAAPPPVVAPTPSGLSRATLGVVGVTAGAAFVLGGIAAHITREVVVSDAASQGCGYDPSGRLVGPSACVDRVSTIDVATALTWTGYVLGAAFVGVGVALVVSSPRAPAHTTLRCAPAWGGAMCTLRF